MLFSHVPRQLTEQYVIYNVTKEEYHSCQLRTPEGAKIVAVCNTPYTPKFYTLSFRTFSPIPGGLEFRPGQNYYFIATNYLEKRPICSHPPMRLIFRIHNEDFVSKLREEPREMPMKIDYQIPSKMPKATEFSIFLLIFSVAISL